MADAGAFGYAGAVRAEVESVRAEALRMLTVAWPSPWSWR